MATQFDTAFATPDAILATYGEVTEENDRIATLELMAGMQEGDRCALALRRWGHGHWVECNGSVWLFTRRVDAAAAAERWIAEGREQ